MTELETLKAIATSIAGLIAAKEGGGATSAPASPAPLPFSEGALDPSLMAIQFWRGPGFDYANRPTQVAPGRAFAIPSMLDEIGQYKVDNWMTQSPPVSFMDYLLMLHDLVPALTTAQRQQIINSRWGAKVAPGMSFLNAADRWLFPEKYQTEEDKANAAKSKAEWDAWWAAKERAGKEQQSGGTTGTDKPNLPGIG